MIPMSIGNGVIGKVGGNTTKARHGKAFYSKIAKMAMAKRWGSRHN